MEAAEVMGDKSELSQIHARVTDDGANYTGSIGDKIVRLQIIGVLKIIWEMENDKLSNDQDKFSKFLTFLCLSLNF